MEVIDNPIDLARFDPSRLDRLSAREQLGVGDGPLLGVVGQITPWKGQEDAIRALPLIRRVHPDAQLLVVGEAKFVAAATRFDNRAYEAAAARGRRATRAAGRGAVPRRARRRRRRSCMRSTSASFRPGRSPSAGPSSKRWRPGRRSSRPRSADRRRSSTTAAPACSWRRARPSASPRSALRAARRMTSCAPRWRAMRAAP